MERFQHWLSHHIVLLVPPHPFLVRQGCEEPCGLFTDAKDMPARHEIVSEA